MTSSDLKCMPIAFQWKTKNAQQKFVLLLLPVVFSQFPFVNRVKIGPRRPAAKKEKKSYTNICVEYFNKLKF